MNGRGRKLIRRMSGWLLAAALGVTITGCGPSYRELRRQGQEAMIGESYGTARIFFEKADDKRPRRVENLHDMGVCSVMLARDKFKHLNQAAGMRELDAAIAYYDAALNVHPGHQASLEGKTVALRLKGQFDAAVSHAEWAVEFVGPSARQYILLARELEDRGDFDGALLRYRQAVTVEPRNSQAHVSLANFLLKHDNERAAIHHLQAAYRLNPADTWVTDQLASRGALPSLAPDEERRP